MIKTDVLRFLLVRLFAARGVPGLPFSVAVLKVSLRNILKKESLFSSDLIKKQIFHRCKSEVLQEQVSKNVLQHLSSFVIFCSLAQDLMGHKYSLQKIAVRWNFLSFYFSGASLINHMFKVANMVEGLEQELADITDSGDFAAYQVPIQALLCH